MASWGCITRPRPTGARCSSLDVRPAWLAADARGGRRVRRGRAAPTPMNVWSIGCWPRRAMASAWARLAGHRALRRVARLRQGQAAAERVAVSRLCDRLAQRRQAVSRFVLEQFAGDVLFPEIRRPRSPPASSRPARGISSAIPSCARNDRQGDRPLERSRRHADDRDVDLYQHDGALRRCHDHKFDPIKQEDYYRLQAVFSGVDRADQTYFDADTGRECATLAGEQERATAEQKKLSTSARQLRARSCRRSMRNQNATDELATLPDPFASASDSSGSPTNGYHSEIASSDTEAKWVQVDLGQSVPIDLVRLVPARPTDFRDTPGFGFPLRFRVAVSNDPTVATGDVIADRTGENFANPGMRPVAFAPQQTQTARCCASRPKSCGRVRMISSSPWPSCKSSRAGDVRRGRGCHGA